MFNLSTETIKGIVSRDIYERGCDYYFDGRVEDFRFDIRENAVRCTVIGRDKYKLNVKLKDNGAIGYKCDCEESGPCKHVVAFLLEIIDRDERGYFDIYDKDKGYVQNPIFDVFDQIGEAHKTKVNLEFTLSFNNKSSLDNPRRNELTMKTGLDKLYVIRDIREFVGNVINNRPQDFGLRFSYNPFEHEYDSGDIKVLELLNGLIETENYLKPAWGRSGYNSCFMGKTAYLPQHVLRKLLEIKLGSTLKIKTKSDTREIEVREQDTPMDFSLAKLENDLILDIKVADRLTIMEDTVTYILTDEAIYKNSQDHIRKIKPFLYSMIKLGRTEMVFREQERERFVSEILSHTEEIGEIHIDEEVSSSILKLPLQAEIYLDRQMDTYTAEVKFVYDDRVINPFTAADDVSRNSEVILLRDSVRESAILNILSGTDFRVRSNMLHTADDDTLFEFLTESLPKLQELAAVYYSDTFKSTKVKSKIAMKGAVSYINGPDLLQFDFDFEGIDRDELRQVLQSMKEKRRYFKLKDGGFLDLGSDEVINMADFIDSLSLEMKDIENGRINLPGYRAVYLDRNIRGADHVKVERDHHFKELVQNITEPEDMSFDIPEELEDVLRDYQKFGFKWLKTLSHYGMGGVLADDMGLGKTLQVLAYILSEKDADTRPALIIAPTSLLYNWKAEIKKFVPQLRCVIVSGSKEERVEIAKTIPDYDIAITSYPLVRRDMDLYENMIFSVCVIDEAQHIKNHMSLNAKSVKNINAATRFALTGTPMENNLSELWSIFDFVIPQYLFSHSKFSENYEKPIVREGDQNAMADLSRHISPFILRRMKKDVLSELPDKIESKMVSELTTEQKKVYLAWMQKIKGEIFDEIREEGFEKSHIKILAGLTRLRQICCHPALFLDNYDDDSGKLLQLEEIIHEAVDGGHRVLVFSQFTSMLRIIAGRLEAEDISHYYLDGSTKVNDRGVLVESFNDGGADVFLISLKAGGTGLNLTGADMVIHYDPWWNPAVEDQAADRAHRIGQDKVVQVIKLIAEGTIEEKIFELQQRKKALIDSVIQPGQTLLTKLTREDVESLFTV